MRKKTYLKLFINYKYFDFPKGFFKSKFTAFKFRYLNNKINLVDPYIFVCNKTTEFDRFLITNTLNGHFVFLKDSIVQQLHEGTLSDEDRTELLKSFKELKDALISVVIFPEKNVTIFGKPEILPYDITDFLYETQFDIKFLSLVGTFFAMPIWANEFRPCETRYHHQFTINYKDVKKLDSERYNDLINNYMPSSASVYSHRYNPYIRSNNKAKNLETVLYCCPNCKKFFSLFSEFNCIKCFECGTALEFSANGTILLSRNVTDLDSFAEFQFNELNKLKFNPKKPLIEYHPIKVLNEFTSTQSAYMGLAKISIYCNKIIIGLPAESLVYHLKDIVRVEFRSGNIVSLSIKTGDKILLGGTNKENFYIIYDLYKIMNGIKD